MEIATNPKWPSFCDLFVHRKLSMSFVADSITIGFLSARIKLVKLLIFKK